jgi:hypothetical protein
MNRKFAFERIESAPRWIFLLLSGYLMVEVVTLYVWNATAAVFQLSATLDSSPALSVIAMSAIGVWLCLEVLRGFPPGAPLRAAWILIAAAAGVRVLFGITAGLLDWCSSVPAGDAAQTTWAVGLRHVTVIASGPIQMILLSAALAAGYRVLRRFGFSSRLRALDWAAFALTVQFTLICFAEAAFGNPSDRHLTIQSLTSLGGHAVLCLLFLQAMRLRNSLRLMGNGLVSKCWTALVCGVMLTAIGDVVLWVIPHYFATWPMAIVESLVRIPSAAAFALAPAYQIAAQRRATQAPDTQEVEVVAGLPAHRLS